MPPQPATSHNVITIDDADTSKLPRASFLVRSRRALAASVSSSLSTLQSSTPEVRAQAAAAVLLALLAVYCVVSLVRALPALLLSLFRGLYSGAQGVLNEGIETLPPEIRPFAKGAMMTALATTFASAPPAAIYYVYRVYTRIRYLEIQVPESSDIFAWVTMYLSQQHESTKKQASLEVRLKQEKKRGGGSGGRNESWWRAAGGGGDDAEKDSSLVFDLVKNASTPDFLVTSRDGSFSMPLKVRRATDNDNQPAKGKDGTNAPVADKLYILIENAPWWQVWAWGDSSRAREIVQVFIERCRDLYEKEINGKLVVWTLEESPWGEPRWTRLCTRNKRKMDTMFLPGNLVDDVLTDCQSFLADRARYEELGIPYRRGYLLYGMPGCGKSSFIAALASELDLPICFMDLTGSHIKDSKLQMLVNAAPARCILCVEEVDTLFLSKEEAEKERKIHGADGDDDFPNFGRRRGRMGGGEPDAPKAPPPPPRKRSMVDGQVASVKALLVPLILLLRDANTDSQAKLTAVSVAFKALKTTSQEAKSSSPSPSSGGSAGGGVALESTRAKPTPPLESTSQWAELIAILQAQKFNVAESLFEQPLQELKRLQSELGSLRLSVSIADAKTIRETFVDVDVDALAAALDKFVKTLKATAETDAPPAPTTDAPYKSKTECRTPSKHCGVTFSGLLQVLDGITAQEGRLVFFTTNHLEKLDEALIRPGRMDRHFELKAAGSNEIRRQFVHMFGKVRLVDGTLLKPEDVEAQSRVLEALVERARGENSTFKMPSLATTQVYFQTKFREPNPMQAVIDCFDEYFKVGATAVVGGLPAVDSGALTRRNTVRSPVSSAGGADF